MKIVVKTWLVMGMLFLSTATFSQTKARGLKQNDDVKKAPKTYLELMVNVVSTNFNYGGNNSALADYKRSNNGIQVGASFQAGITPAFSIVSELYFMRKGGKLKSNNPLTNHESSIHFNTIEIPVLARFHFGKFYTNVGPSIAYNISGSSTIEDVSSKLSFNNPTAGFKRFETGIQMGGGVEFPIKQRRIALDIRYNYGLTNIGYNKDIYNRAVMISVHFSKPWKTNPLGRNS